MADLTVAEFKARFSQFTNTEPEISALIEDTLEAFDQIRWGGLYKRGHSLYIAHLLSLATLQQAGNAGALDTPSQQSVDQVSASFSVYQPTNSNEAFFNGTSYGREYLNLLRSVGIGGTANTGGLESVWLQPWDSGGNEW